MIGRIPADDALVQTSAGVRNRARPTIPRRRRWWFIPVCIVLGLLCGFAYLATAGKIYTSRAILAVENTGMSPDPAAPLDVFLATQRRTLLSQSILSEAGVESLRDALNVEVLHGDNVISISIESKSPREAARAVDAIVQSYLKRQKTETPPGLAELTVRRGQLVTDRATREKALADHHASVAPAGTLNGGTDARANQLNAALGKAKQEAEEAQTAIKKAEPLLSDPATLKQLIESNRGTGILGGLDQVHAQITAEIAQLEAQYVRQTAGISAQHPVVVAMQKKIESTRVKLAEVDRKCADAWRSHLESNHTAAKRKVSELQKLLDTQTKPQSDDSADAVRVAALEADLKTAEAALADIDAKIRDAARAGDATAPVIKVIQPATMPTRATRPNQQTALLVSGAAGLIAGLLLVLIFPQDQGAVFGPTVVGPAA